jgi:hypothetical protein
MGEGVKCGALVIPWPTGAGGADRGVFLTAAPCTREAIKDRPIHKQHQPCRSGAHCPWRVRPVPQTIKHSRRTSQAITSQIRRCSCPATAGAGWPRSDARRASAQAFRGNNFEEIDVTHLLSAGTTFKDVPIPFPHVTVTVLAATIRIRGLALPVSDRNPVIFDADENSLCLPIFLVQARGGCGGTEPDGQCRAWETPSVAAAGSLGCCGTAKRGGKRHSMEENDGRMGSR